MNANPYAVDWSLDNRTIARQLGYTSSSVSRLRKMMSAPRIPTNRPHFAPTDAAVFRDRLAAGESLNEIGRSVGYSVSTIKRAIISAIGRRAYDAILRGRGQSSADRRRKLSERRCRGGQWREERAMEFCNASLEDRLAAAEVLDVMTRILT